MTCKDCPRTLGAKNTTGWCRWCWGAELRRRSAIDPAIEARRRESVRQAMRHLNQTYWGDTDNKVKQATYCGERNSIRSKVRMAWCPPSLRAYNDFLVLKKFTAAERRQLIASAIEDQRLAGKREVERIAADLQARRARDLEQAL